jgi:hypothetical protein
MKAHGRGYATAADTAPLPDGRDRRGRLRWPAASAALPAIRKNSPPNVPEWTRALGDGVAVRPYGKPSKHEAHVIAVMCNG